MTESTDYAYLIIGGGMSADSAARGIREIDESGSIGILGQESDPPATRPALSKKLWTDPDFSLDQIWLGTQDVKGVVWHGGTKAVTIDRESRTVRTEDGSVYGYGTLLIATGGSPRSVDLPQDERVILFRSVEDYRRLRRLAGGRRRIAVVGGSFIGTELAAALAQNDTDVTLVFPDEILGGSVFPDRLAQRFQELFERAGVTLLPGVTLEKGTAHADHVDLELSDGKHLEVDAVVTGLGIEPSTDIAEGAGLRVDDGVVVDEYLRTDDPRIFATGDVASYPDVILGRGRIEHVDNATEMGRQAGRNLAGADEKYDHTPYFYSVIFGKRYEAVGTLDSSLTTVEDSSDSSDSAVVYYVDGDRVAGVLLWQVEEQRDAARSVIADTTDVSPEALRGRIPVDG